MPFEEFLQLYIGCLNVVLPNYLKKDNCCLSATRIGMEVFKRFGIVSRPSTCDMAVSNKMFDEMVRVVGTTPTEAQAKEWQKKGAFYCWAGRQGPTTPDRWPNHLVLVSGEYVIDGSFKQFNRPSQFHTNISGGIWIKHQPTDPIDCFQARLPTMTVMLKLTEGDQSFLTIKDFQPEISKNAVNEIVELMNRVKF